MKVHDLSHNHRIARLTQLTQELQQSRTPEQTFETLLRAFFDVGGFVASLLLSTGGLPAGHYRVLRAQLEDGSPPPRRPTGAEPLSVHSGGVVAAIIARPGPQLIENVEWELDPYLRKTLRGYSSVMAIPLKGAHLPMNWAILLKRPPEQFTESDLEEAVERASLSCALLENQVLATELALAHDQIDSDARQVGELQRALLPASLPRIAGLQIAASYEPSGRAGGDLYDFFPLSNPPPHPDPASGSLTPCRWCGFIGDASGHGLAPAVVMAIVQAVLHAHPAGIDGPAALLAHANRQLCDKRIGGFFTAFLAIYEPSSRRLTYANAGHPRPLLRRGADGLISSLDAVVNYPLGIDRTETFNEATVQLETGDVLLLYTDGITESRNARNAQLDSDPLARVVREPWDGPANLIQRLRDTVLAHQRGQPASDDQTLVAVMVL